MAYYFDFDHTLFDTDLFFHVHLRSALLRKLRITEQDWQQTYEYLLSSEYSIEAHLERLGVLKEDASETIAWLWRTFGDLRPYVFVDVVPTLATLAGRGETINLITAGNAAWQSYKVRGSGLWSYFGAVMIAEPPASKLAILRSHGMTAYDAVVDNDPALLDDIRQAFGTERTYLINRVPKETGATGIDDLRYFEARRYLTRRSVMSHTKITALTTLL